MITDHHPLVWLHNLKDPVSRLARWRIKLKDYQYEIQYKPGKVNSNADALSRNPVDDDKNYYPTGPLDEKYYPADPNPQPQTEDDCQILILHDQLTDTDSNPNDFVLYSEHEIGKVFLFTTEGEGMGKVDEVIDGDSIEERVSTEENIKERAVLDDPIGPSGGRSPSSLRGSTGGNCPSGSCNDDGEGKAEESRSVGHEVSRSSDPMDASGGRISGLLRGSTGGNCPRGSRAAQPKQNQKSAVKQVLRREQGSSENEGQEKNAVLKQSPLTTELESTPNPSKIRKISHIISARLKESKDASVPFQNLQSNSVKINC